MAPPLVTYPDVEELVVDLLDAALDCTVGVGVPDGWTTEDGDHLQVACDGTPIDEHPIAQRHTVRLTAWSANPTPAKTLLYLAHGHLIGSAGANGLSTVSPLTGVLPAHDDDHDAELASCTVRVRVRSTPIT